MQSKNTIQSDLIYLHHFPKTWEVDKCVRQVLAAFRKLKLIPKKQNVVISLSCVDSNEIRFLNKKFRKIDHETDILSFEQPKTQGGLNLIFLGDLVICKEVLIKQARSEKHKARDELQVLITHGFLHLLGFDHEASKIKAQRMKSNEDKILKLLKGKSGLIQRSTV